MNKLKSEEINEIKEKLSKEYYPNVVEFLGYNRFKIQEKYYPSIDGIDGNPTPIPRDKFLLDEQGKNISLANSYDFFSRVLFGGVIVVIIHHNLKFVKDRYSNNNKAGLINIDGIELIPCIYDSIEPKGDGVVFISKDGQRKATSLTKVINGKFDWDKAIERNK